MKTLASLTLSFLFVLPLVAAAEPSAILVPSGGSCEGGLVFDDGTFEQAYGLSPTDAGRMVMRITGEEGAALTDVCLCWIRNGSDPQLDFDVVFYESDGAGGPPGPLVAAVPARIGPVATSPPGSFFAIDVASAAIRLPADGLYVGAGWSSNAEPGFFLCADENGPTETPGYVSTQGGAVWQRLDGANPGYRALGVRAQASLCVADGDTLCLADGRFQVELEFRTPSGIMDSGRAVPFGSDDSGLFYFFRADNWEMLVKVLDACGLNNRFWVFYAATTNVEFTLTVTDTQTGAVREYSNPQGNPAAPVQDTGAFVCS